MPKDEIDPEDPMELCGVGLLTEEDTSEPMTECFIEEFLRMGYNAKQVLALFCNPHYTGMNMVIQTRGEPFVKDKIVEVFGWWKRPVNWAGQSSAGVPPAPHEQALLSCDHPASKGRRNSFESGEGTCAPLTDPMGNVMPPLD